VVRDGEACDGRVVHLRKPTVGGICGPSQSGVAVLDNGPFAGQRVEFEAKQCSVFGVPLAKADLSQVFTYGV